MSLSSAAVHRPPRNRLVGQRLGRYEILHLLASGGMGSVYAGRRAGVAGFERLVAVKVLHPHLAYEEEFIRMFMDEARLAARLRHPNAVATLDIEECDEGYILVMEYVEGASLATLTKDSVAEHAQLPIPAVLSIVCGTLEGLYAAHNLCDSEGKPLNLVHRDVSPHNILVSTDGVARLTDFGIAKAEVNLSTTRTGQIKGKFAYMSPEQVRDEEIRRTTDIFAMGIVLWEALTRRRLFRGESDAETFHKVMYAPIPAPSSFFPELAPLDAAVLRALQRDPSQRFQTAHEMIVALEKVAPAVGGLASQREVAALVRVLAQDKLLAEANAISTAIRSSRAAGPLTPEIPISRSNVQIPKDLPGTATKARRDAAAKEEHTSSAIITVSPPIAQRKRQLVFLLSTLIFCAALIGGYALSPKIGRSAHPWQAPALPSVQKVSVKQTTHDFPARTTATQEPSVIETEEESHTSETTLPANDEPTAISSEPPESERGRKNKSRMKAKRTLEATKPAATTKPENDIPDNPYRTH